MSQHPPTGSAEQGFTKIEWRAGLTGKGITNAGVEKKETKPPSLYDEGTLIQAMKNAARLIEDPRLREMLRDKGGIGTPATRADIIKGLLKKQVIKKNKAGKLEPTEYGAALLGGIPKEYRDPATTAIWESFLGQIETSGDKEKFEKFYNSSVQNTRLLWEKLIASKIALPGEEGVAADRPCSDAGCSDGGTLSQFNGKYGKCWKCSKCEQFLDDVDGKPVKKAAKAAIEPLDGDGETCTKCEKGKMKTLLAKAQNKRFLKCSNERCGNAKYPVEAGWTPRN